MAQKIAKKHWPKKITYLKYPTTKILFVIKKKKKKLGMPRFQIISKIVLSIRNNNK